VGKKIKQCPVVSFRQKKKRRHRNTAKEGVIPGPVRKKKKRIETVVTRDKEKSLKQKRGTRQIKEDQKDSGDIKGGGLFKRDHVMKKKRNMV